MQSNIQARFPNTTLLLAGTFLLGLVLRLGWIDAHGLWNDEITSVLTAQSGLSFVFNNHFGWVGNQTSWHYAFVWSLLQPLDPVVSPVLVRLPSALAGAFLSLVVYGLGRELFSRTAGLVAAFMVALSPVLLDYSHDLRPYSLLAFFTSTSVFCLVMAERTGKAIWWLGFLATMAANVLNSYFAVTLVLPALSPYLAWAAVSAWRERRQQVHARNFLYLMLSMLAVGIVAGLMLLEYLRLPATPIDWNKFAITSLANMPVNVFASFTALGMNGLAGSLISLALLLLGILGVYAGTRQGHVRGVVICLALCLAPSFVLAVIVTSSLVFSRYVLFIGPFYYLLIGNAVATLLQVKSSLPESGHIRRLARPTGAVLLWLLLALYLFGTFSYLNPATHHDLSYRPDFRGVADYLSRKASPQDTIVLADYPPTAYNVTTFYWHNKPPAHLYDARDPRLFHQPMQGHVYWVLSFLDHQLMRQLMDQLAAPNQGWTDVAKLEDALVLEENGSGRQAADVVEQMADKLDALNPGFAPTNLLRGGVLQARGDAVGAARLYRDAVSGFWLGDMSLRTAEGFDNVGLYADAWREGIISKAMEPYRPEAHRWLAQHLRQAGYNDESRMESNIADVLQSDAAAKPK